jgi:hypothetical protein
MACGDHFKIQLLYWLTPLASQYRIWSLEKGIINMNQINTHARFLNNINSKIPLCNRYVDLRNQETLLRCGFHADTIVAWQRFLHHQYQ